ncbi:MAG: hypothetical protein M3442_00050, partial [Chloroflexota bacterium]|nr:hypothetical protein [Chloroflexota bacterium]
MRQGQLWRGMALGLLVLAALAMGWTSPEAAGDLRPSPDAVEYGMAAVALARLQPPEVRVAGIAVPPRYPFGFPLLATPFVRWAAQGGEPQPHAAVLASAAAGAVVVGCLAVAGWQAFGAATAMVAVALVLVSPFYGTYARLVMAEMPTAALFGAMAAVVALSAGQPSARGRWWGAGLGLLMAAAVSVRLGNVQAVPAVAAGLWCAAPQRRAGALTSLVIALAIGTMPLLAYNATTYGSPLTTGYHLWTPEWMEGGRQQFALRYALDSPALPAGAVQG